MGKENRILKMSRVMSLLQRLKLFGAYFWLGRQTMQAPAEKVSVPEAPPQMCKINTKAPDCEYWIAVERVLCWGARQGTHDDRADKSRCRRYRIRSACDPQDCGVAGRRINLF